MGFKGKFKRVPHTRSMQEFTRHVTAAFNLAPTCKLFLHIVDGSGQVSCNNMLRVAGITQACAVGSRANRKHMICSIKDVAIENDHDVALVSSSDTVMVSVSAGRTPDTSSSRPQSRSSSPPSTPRSTIHRPVVARTSNKANLQELLQNAAAKAEAKKAEKHESDRLLLERAQAFQEKVRAQGSQHGKKSLGKKKRKVHKIVAPDPAEMPAVADSSTRKAGPKEIHARDGEERKRKDKKATLDKPSSLMKDRKKGTAKKIRKKDKKDTDKDAGKDKKDEDKIETKHKKVLVKKKAKAPTSPSPSRLLESEEEESESEGQEEQEEAKEEDDDEAEEEEEEPQGQEEEEEVENREGERPTEKAAESRKGRGTWPRLQVLSKGPSVLSE